MLPLPPQALSLIEALATAPAASSSQLPPPLLSPASQPAPPQPYPPLPQQAASPTSPVAPLLRASAPWDDGADGRPRMSELSGYAQEAVPHAPWVPSGMAAPPWSLATQWQTMLEPPPVLESVPPPRSLPARLGHKLSAVTVTTLAPTTLHLPGLAPERFVSPQKLPKGASLLLRDHGMVRSGDRRRGNLPVFAGKARNGRSLGITVTDPRVR